MCTQIFCIINGKIVYKLFFILKNNTDYIVLEKKYKSIILKIKRCWIKKVKTFKEYSDSQHMQVGSLKDVIHLWNLEPVMIY